VVCVNKGELRVTGNKGDNTTGAYYWGTGVERSDLGALSPVPVNFAPMGSSIVQISSG
jgi:hypothetical protein